VPHFVDGDRGCIGFFAQQAGKADADDMTLVFFGDIQNFGIERYHIGLLRQATLLIALLQIHADFGKHFRRGEFADVCQVTGVVGSLQTDETDLGVADKAINIKTRRELACCC